MTSKTPISILQELMMELNSPLPIYEMRMTGSYFTCTVLAAGSRGSGCSSNKQQAKQNSAQKVLDVINANRQLQTEIEFVAKSSNQQFRNFIGELNEICAKKKQNYPIYSDVELSHCEYAVACKISGFITCGKASNKKDAKQLAAKKMLDSLKENEQDTIQTEEIPAKATDNKILPEDLEILVRKMQQFDDRKISGVSVSMKTETIKTETIKTEYEFDTCELQSNQQLENQLMKSKFKNYKIEVFQQYPLILVIKFVDTPYVLLEMGPDYNTALNTLLKKALEILPLLGN